MNWRILKIFLFVIVAALQAAAQKDVFLVNVGEGWAANSINTVIFRKNSLASFKDTQFIAYYDAEQNVVVGKRKLGSKNWELKKTNFKGKATDAHNTISIITDGDGYLHMAWNHHNNPLHYARSISPGSLQFSDELPMTGLNESKLTYPEFHCLRGGNLLFLYRDGASGQGNLVINRYDVKTKKWKQLHKNLVDGEGKRNAYWQACVDVSGVLHISWVWRETPDVASNHDLCYAQSKDGGETWQTSDGKIYQLPITMKSAETVCAIPQGSELINQTSMTTDQKGHPLIATYWRPAGTSIPQYQVVAKINGAWKTYSTGFLKTAFTLGGAGTKRVPISRPQIIAGKQNSTTVVVLIFRDEARGNKVSVAFTTDLAKNQWTLKDLTNDSVGSWEPTYDTRLWQQKHSINLFVEYVEQVDGEGKSAIKPQMVQVLEWNPFSVLKK